MAKLLKDVLPDLSPRLFPHLEGPRWVRRAEYEIPKVLELGSKIRRIQVETKSQVEGLERDIEYERVQWGFLYDLLNGTGTTLVSAVKKTLELLGFKSIVDVDEEMSISGGNVQRREDLQIHDSSPVVLVEVKGITGMPRESESLQIGKYIAPRMKEWSRTDVRGLSIINYQRHIPPLERDNNNVFQKDVLTNALNQQFGLMTAWDLSRLLRSFLKNGWEHRHVKNLFYQDGRIDPIPAHYKYVGVIEQYWEKVSAITVSVDAESIRKGDLIAFELASAFEEQIIESLEVEKQPANEAPAGATAGIKTKLNKEQARKGTRVFRVDQDSTD